LADIANSCQLSDSSTGTTSPETEDPGRTIDTMGFVDPRSLAADLNSGLVDAPMVEDRQIPDMTPEDWLQQHDSRGGYLVTSPTHGCAVDGAYNLPSPSVRPSPTRAIRISDPFSLRQRRRRRLDTIGIVVDLLTLPNTMGLAKEYRMQRLKESTGTL
jgi:hypothetical protein